MPRNRHQKTIYLVRHGESTENDSFAHDHAPLSTAGRQQARMLAQRLSGLRIDAMLVSTMPRAHETATIVAKRIGRRMETHRLLEELRVPSELLGKKLDDPVTKRVMRQMRKEFMRGGRYADEENFKDRRDRAVKILRLLASHKKRHLLVVAHSGIIRYLLACILFGMSATYKQFQQLRTIGPMTNTGVTVFKILENGEWRLVTWNDVAHLE